MRSFKVPFDVLTEEKIFKGILSLRQMAYMSLSILSIGFLFIKIPIFFRIIIFLFIAAFCSVLAFLEIDGIYFDKYLKYYINYFKKNKQFLYKK